MAEIIRDEDFVSFLAEQQSQYLMPAVDFSELAVQAFVDGNLMPGLKLPWPKTQDKFALRPGEVTLWAGINGHGKTALLGQICALTIPATRWLIASLEMPIRETIKRLVKHIAGISNPTPEYIEAIMASTDGRLWLYDQIDTVPADNIIAMIHYASTKLSIEHIIIDSLVKCGMAVDDYNAQKRFVDKLCWAAKRHNIHIHLVHHIRKSEREGKIPDKFDIKGAGEITDLVDNVCIVHRNKDKEANIQNGKKVDPLLPDTMLIVAKQRHNGFEPHFGFYFHPESGQFISKPGQQPFQFHEAQQQNFVHSRYTSKLQ